MTNKKQSSKQKASDAAKVLTDPNASNIKKGLAGSVLAQSNTKKVTGKDMEKKASQVLQSNKYSDETKSLAGSVLSQSSKKR